MSKQPILPVIAAALLCAASPVRAQPGDFPEGPGKQTFVTLCGACHDLNGQIREFMIPNPDDAKTPK